MKRKLTILGLMVVAVTALCSCNNNNNDDEWKYPRELYVECFDGSNTIMRYTRKFINNEHSKAGYRYDGNTLTVRESKENSNTTLVDGHYQTEYLGTWGEESTYEYVRCPFWVII